MIFGKHVNRYYLKYAPLLLAGLFALLVVDYFQLKIPEFYRMIVNGMNGGSVDLGNGSVAVFDMQFLLDEICLPMILTIFAMVISRFAWRICFFGTAIRVETDLRNRMFDHAKDLSREYYQVNKVGNLMSLFTNDLETIHECFAMGVLSTFDAALLGTMVIFKMWRMDPLLTLFSLIPMAFLLIVGLIVRKSMMRKWAVRQEAFSELSDFSQESFSGLSVIKAFVKEAKELLAFRWLNKKHENANVEYTRTSTMMNVFVTLFVESVICVILGYGGYLVHTGAFDAGKLVEYVGYFLSIVWPIMAVTQILEMSSRGMASLKRISELLDAKIDVKDAPDVQELRNVQGSIEFRDLTFRYPGGEFNALESVSFTIKAGQRVGIVGKTGSGKTTVVDLILRSYNVEDGRLFIDGKDVNRISIRSLRDAVAYVPQDNFLFSDTIENNIAFSGASTKHADITRAAELSGVHGDISSFKEGYETVLGERGVTVSGGQKQRISIARALLKDAPILILDDSVSAVDTATEKEILKNLDELRKGKTTILIAHRISTIENMDMIVYIENGTVLATGTHEQLLSSCREYAAAVELQKLESEEGSGRV